MSTPIFILAGQSNASRPGVRIGTADGAEMNGALFIPLAVSGTPLAQDLDHGQGDWSASGDEGAGEHLDTLYGVIDDLLNPNSPNYIPDAYLAGVVWVQGEADAFSDEAAAAYNENLIELRDALVARYGPHEWIISALSELSWEGRAGPQRVEDNWMTIREGQLALDQVDGFTVIDPDVAAAGAGILSVDMFDPDRVHYTAVFGQVLGHALSGALQIAAGDVRLQIGGEEREYFTIEGEFAHEVFASTGLDSVDFSAIEHGIRVDSRNSPYAAVRDINGPSDFSATLVEVERVYGTDHADEFRLGTYLRDLRAGGGNDRVYVTGDLSINVQMGDGDDRVYGGGGNDNIIGQNGRDILYGNGGADRLFGGEGHDRLYGGDGDDLMVGDRGHDRLDGGAGADHMSGGEGHDNYYVDDVNDIVVENSNEGRDQVRSSVSYTLSGNIEQLHLIDGAGDLNGTGNEIDNRIYGNDGNNQIIGAAGNDFLYGGEGDDVLLGGLGDDRLYGGNGSDLLEGGHGNDRYYVDDSNDLIVEAVDGGTDFVEASTSFTLTDNIENIRVGNSGGDVDGTGNGLSNNINGGAGANVLSGLGGNDNINGRDGDDVLFGGDGNDRMNGGNGNDVLYGESGNDRLSGGAGSDSFVFGQGSGYQIVSDFEQGVDHVYVDGLSGLDVTYTQRGNGVLVDLGNDQVIYFQNVGSDTPLLEDLLLL